MSENCTSNDNVNIVKVAATTNDNKELKDQNPKVEDGDDSNKFVYETQLFEFTPITFLNGMYNAVCDFYRQALKTFCDACKERCPDLKEDQLRQSRHLISERIDKDICKIFDTLEYYSLNQVFAIPENAVLPEDKCQLAARDKEHDISEIEKRKNEVKKKIIAMKYANAVLSQHLENAEALQGTLDTMLKNISSNGTISQVTAKGLKDWLSYTSQLLTQEENAV
uniref:Protein MIS12 homolog n=1 Tax=Biomphalaria glabrata TaxID=6526 RepID=A0A2C9LWP9_BIOGL